jgi:hypothetical protein
MTAFTATRLRPDIHDLYAARALRGFGDGFAIIVLPVSRITIPIVRLIILTSTASTPVTRMRSSSTTCTTVGPEPHERLDSIGRSG